MLEDFFIGSDLFVKILRLILVVNLLGWVINKASPVVYVYLISCVSGLALLLSGLFMIQLSLNSFILDLINPIKKTNNYFQVKFWSIVMNHKEFLFVIGVGVTLSGLMTLYKLIKLILLLIKTELD